MKKLLAAVTSFAMSASLMTSAFASSFNVSAAGRVSAVQPNVSIGEVADVAVNKTAQADFVVTPEEVSVNPGETVKVKIYADAGSHKVATFIVELANSDLPQGITADVAEADLRCKAVSGTYTFQKLNGRYYCDTLDSGEPMEVDSTKPVIAFTLSVPSSAKPGDYTYNLSHFHVVEDGYNGVEFDATVKPGTIHVLGSGDTTTPSVTTTAPSGDVSVVATTKAPDPSLNIDNGFIVTPEDVSVAAGESVNIPIYCENTSNRKVAQFITQVIDSNLPIPGATATMKSVKCSCIPVASEYKELNGTWYCDTLDSGEPQEIDTSKPVARFNITVPAGTAAGKYTWYIDRFHVVENGYEAIEFDATIKPGTITVTSGGEVVSTTAQQGETTTTTTPSGTKPASVDEKFIIKPEDVSVAPGDSINIGLYCENGSNRKAGQFIVRVDDANLPISGATATMKSVKCNAVATKPEYKEIEGTWYCDCLDSGDPQEINTDEPVARYQITIPADAKAGTYEWMPDRFHVVENGYEAIEFDANIKPGKITVLGDDTTTTTTATTTIAGDTSTITTATTAAPANGSVEWKIPKVNAKAGSTVKMDVVVNGASDLAVAGAQFKVSAASPVTFEKVDSTSAAYKADVQNNASTNEFAFANEKGGATAAADGAVVMSLYYKVPADASGTYAVKWSDVFVSDTNGNDITSKVTLTDGAIVVAGPVDGNIEWQIPTVHAKAGSTATLNVTVEDAKGEGLKVAGAQFAIKAETVEFSSVSEKSDAYKSNIVNNKNEFAFGEGKGAGVAAADGANVMTLKYTVPAGTKAGTYAVSWTGDIFISDTDGNDITANVTLTDGAIIVDDVTEGKVTWTIPEKHAVPGETVEMDVLVTAGDENLAVGGAQFNIVAKTPIALDSATGSTGYKADLEYNKETNEFAFAQDKGTGVKAENGSSVLKLTYTVPENATPGEYPVEWSKAFISDTDGNDITADVTLVDGVIIIDDGTTTTTGPVSTTSGDTDTTTTTSENSQGDSTTTTTGTEAPVTVTAPAGAIIWQIQRVNAEPGQTVTVPVLVLDPNGVDLPVGGAQFGVTAKTPIAYASVSAKSDAYGSDIVANESTFEFAFADAKGGEKVAANNAAVFELTFNVPEGTAAGEYPVEWTKAFFNASNSKGEDISSYIVCLDGAIIVNVPSSTTTGETTTASDSTTTSTPETTTTLTVAEGSIIWQVPTVEAAPGEEVSLDVVVLDPNDTKLEVGGAQFIAKADGVTLSGGTGSEAYSADIEQGKDGDANRFAFAHPKGQGVAAANGAKVITLKYTVPETAKDGDKYPVTLDELNASDTNGLDITKHILVLPGAIEVKVPESTTSGTTTATGSTTATASTTATTAVTAPDGAIIWQIQRVTAKAGQTVTVPVLVLDPNGAKLPIGGAQFGVTAKSPIAYDSISDTESYGATVVGNTSTFEFAFANTKGAEVAADNGAVVFNLTYKVPEGTAAGEYPVEWTKAFFNVSNSNGNDLTNFVICLDGAIIVEEETITTSEVSTTSDTTTTASETGATDTGSTSTTASETGSTDTGSTSTTASETGSTDTGSSTTTATGTTLPEDAKYVIVEGTAIDGFYFNHDGRTFNKGHVTVTKLTVVKTDGTSEEATFDASALSFKEQVSGKDNPMEAYREEQTDFTYVVDVLYGGKPLEFADGKPVTFKAYIGVKGDSNLDNKADAKDASNALAFYAKVSTKAADESADDIRLNPDTNEVINNNPDLDLDQFGAFLVDVDKDVYDADNWKTTKSGRVIDAKDASWILAYYSKMSTGETDRQKAWNETILGREEKIADFLIK